MTLANGTLRSDIAQEIDVAEIEEWWDSFDWVLRSAGAKPCKELLRNLREHARSQDIEINSWLNNSLPQHHHSGE
jgi:pyruvate dehydrogenase complex dehydrogenase (E1) component